jgi:ribose 1,5-bisphosphokinase
MTQRLIFVVGPSGAGKDSVLDGLRKSLTDHPGAADRLHWARRTITRPAKAGGEAHEPLSEDDFLCAEANGEFAIAWHANGLHYGVRHIELEPLSQDQWVLVNGSRAYLSELRRKLPDTTVVHITAPSTMLRQRLQSRQRESAAAIEERLARNERLAHIPNAIEVCNDGTISNAVQALASALSSLDAWPAPATIPLVLQP